MIFFVEKKSDVYMQNSFKHPNDKYGAPLDALPLTTPLIIFNKSIFVNETIFIFEINMINNFFKNCTTQMKYL